MHPSNLRADLCRQHLWDRTASPFRSLWLYRLTTEVHGVTAEQLDQGFFRLFRLRGVLDPTSAIPGLGASVSEVMALARLQEGGMTQQDLGTYLGLEKSTVSRLVDAMIDKGWVDQVRDPQAPRFKTIRLTAAGRRAARSVGKAMHRRHENMLDGLSAQEASTLIKGLNILVDALEREAERANSH